MTQSQELDQDVAAVRAMIAMADAPEASRNAQIQPLTSAETDRTGQPDTPPKPTKTGSRRLSILSRMILRIRSYRPRSRTILGTSSVLLVLLQPVLVVSVLLIALVGLAVTLLIIGTDTFWRGVLAGLDVCAKWFPQAARSLRVRAQVMSRRWDLLLDRLPGSWTDTLRMPDLRALARADQRHDDAVAIRLRRLADDSV